jgi:hypothetical protein
VQRDDALRVFDQIIAAGYGCEIRATNVQEESGAQYQVGIPIGGYSPGDNLRIFQDVADSNGCDIALVVDGAPSVRSYLVISSPVQRPEHEPAEDGR